MIFLGAHVHITPGCPLYCVTASSKASSFRALRMLLHHTTPFHFAPAKAETDIILLPLDQLTDMNTLNNNGEAAPQESSLIKL